MRRLSIVIDRMRARNLLKDFSTGRTDLYDRVKYDSRDVAPNDCFVAINGHDADGHTFIDKAVKNGAVAIVYEAAPAISREDLAGVACVHVSDTRRALLEMSAYQAGDPAGGLVLVGTTGTNGKTTVATLVQSLMESAGQPCGFIGTTGYRVGEKSYPARETTPSATRVQDLLAEMAEAGCEACSMEVSSHALDQWRVNPADFDAAVFTNVTRDHLDYHITSENYLSAKRRLFEGLGTDSSAIVNVDDPAGKSILKRTIAGRVTFGQTAEADVEYRLVGEDTDGLLVRIDGSNLRTRLAGAFNAGNVAAAYACGLALGLGEAVVREALETADPVPGRFEMISGPDGVNAVVDYAHTPDALEHLLRSARRLVKNGARLWCVFGCGGDRDRGKRSQMGRVAETGADRVVVTSDNPRSEDPDAIIRDVFEGFDQPGNAIGLSDRFEAIQTALFNSRAGDLVVIAGKGHETTQTMGADSIPFDDRAVVRAVFGADEKSI